MAPWRAPIRPAAGLTIAIVVASCRDEGPQSVPAPPAATTTSASEPVSSASAAAAPGVSPGAAPPGDEGLVTLDLASAGEAWVGVTARAPAGATVSGDGSSGAMIGLGAGRSIILSTGSGAIADQRLGATVAARATEGTITFETDTPQAIAYAIRLDDVDGNPLVTRGFAITVPLGPRKVACSYATARDDRELAAARAVCASLARR